HLAAAGLPVHAVRHPLLHVGIERHEPSHQWRLGVPHRSWRVPRPCRQRLCQTTKTQKTATEVSRTSTHLHSCYLIQRTNDQTRQRDEAMMVSWSKGHS